ncbi:MAG: hypothetical protein HY720_25275 [Planctomycetes bacterium]|nr:hypothetical protein [Planctomycetota bacterium]
MSQSEDLTRLRSLAPGERFALGISRVRLAWAALDRPSREDGDRRWAEWLEEHDEGNRNLFAGLALESRTSGE